LISPPRGRCAAPAGPRIGIRAGAGGTRTRRRFVLSSDVGERVLELDQLGGADQLGDAAVEVDGGLEPLGADLLVRDLVVALVGVGADLGEVEVVVDVLEDLAATSSLVKFMLSWPTL
jgi:hypothetical protein